MGDDIKPLPICKQCNKPVERMHSWEDAVRQEDVFVVYCHGETEVSRLTHRLQVQANRIDFGFAFAGYDYDGPCICGTERDDGECMQCAQRECPHGEPLHWHHDGCPACIYP